MLTILSAILALQTPLSLLFMASWILPMLGWVQPSQAHTWRLVGFICCCVLAVIQFGLLIMYLRFGSPSPGLGLLLWPLFAYLGYRQLYGIR